MCPSDMSLYLPLTVRLSTILNSSALDTGYIRYIAVDYSKEGHTCFFIFISTYFLYDVLTARITWQLLNGSKAERYDLAFE